MSYPSRFLVPDQYQSWEVAFPEYAPSYYVAERVLQEPSWADPEDISQVQHSFVSYEGNIFFDKKGRPLNPKGRTGLAGRGVLGKWGKNEAADAIVTRENNGMVELLAIQRKDTKEWAIPGGMLDSGEYPREAAQRELGEETSVKLDLKEAKQVYQGYVDDPRNTDHAWIETTAFWVHTTFEKSLLLPLKEGDDAFLVGWIQIDQKSLNFFYKGHRDILAIILNLV